MMVLEEEWDAATTEPNFKKEKPDSNLLYYITAGIFTPLFILAVIICCIYKRRRNHKRTSKFLYQCSILHR